MTPLTHLNEAHLNSNLELMWIEFPRAPMNEFLYKRDHQTEADGTPLPEGHKSQSGTAEVHSREFPSVLERGKGI